MNREFGEYRTVSRVLQFDIDVLGIVAQNKWYELRCVGFPYYGGSGGLCVIPDRTKVVLANIEVVGIPDFLLNGTVRISAFGLDLVDVPLLACGRGRPFDFGKAAPEIPGQCQVIPRLGFNLSAERELGKVSILCGAAWFIQIN